MIDCGAGVFDGCSELETVRFPKEFRTEGFLGMGMFNECKKLKSVVLPENINSILDGAFLECESLEEVHIPKSVNYLSDSAFESCKNLKDVYFETANCRIEYNAFLGDTGTVIHAPTGGSIQQYCRLHPLLSFSAN